jgi:hypothetical protein
MLHKGFVVPEGSTNTDVAETQLKKQTDADFTLLYDLPRITLCEFLMFDFT